MFEPKIEKHYAYNKKHVSQIAFTVLQMTKRGILYLWDSKFKNCDLNPNLNNFMQKFRT